MNLKLFIIGILILLNMNIGQAAAATSYCGGDIVVHEETDLNATKDATYKASLVPGPHSMTVYAKDKSGNQNSTTRWFSIEAP